MGKERCRAHYKAADRHWAHPDVSFVVLLHASPASYAFLCNTTLAAVERGAGVWALLGQQYGKIERGERHAIMLLKLSHLTEMSDFKKKGVLTSGKAGESRAFRLGFLSCPCLFLCSFIMGSLKTDAYGQVTWVFPCTYFWRWIKDFFFFLKTLKTLPFDNNL